MSGTAADPRAAAAETALGELGLAGVRVRPAGHEREIAVLALPEGRWAALLGEARAEVAAAVRAAGFRYVALDLDPPAPGA